MITAGFLIELALKSLIVAGATLGILRLTRGRSAAERSWIGHAGLIALILIVPAALMIPSWNPLPEAAQPAPVTLAAPTVILPELAQAKLPPGSTIAPAASSGSVHALPDAGELAVWLYGIPVLLLLLAMIVAVIRLSSVHRRANLLVDAGWLEALALAQQRMGFKHGTALLVSDELRSPVSWGMMRPIIVLNRDAVAAIGEAEPIIAHELAHVARLDWAKLLIARLACALFWFNPLVWLLARECHQLREEAADDAVLLSDVDGADYASLLVSAARHDNAALLLAAHGVAPARDSLKRRITRVLDGSLARGPANGAWMLLCVVVLLGLAGPLAALDPLAPKSVKTTSAPAGQAAARMVVAAIGSALGRSDSQDPGAMVAAAIQAAVHDAKAGQRAGNQASGATAGSGNPNADKLIEARAVGLTPDYIAAMRNAGFANATLDELKDAAAVHVTPDFARDMRRYYPSLAIDDMVGLRAAGVDSAYAAQMRGLFPGLSADQLQQLAAVRVSPEFVGAMRHEGLSVKDPDDAIQGRLFVQTSRKRGREARHEATAIAVSPDGQAVSIAGPAGNVHVANGPHGRAVSISGPTQDIHIVDPPDDDDGN